MRTMWFGTKQFSRWIKVHSPGSGYVQGGYSDRLDYLNGLTSIRTSLNGHMEYSLNWNRVTQDEARAITDFASGLYGNGPYYLCEPAAMRQNVLNKAWSAPGLTAKDGVPIVGSHRPEIVPNLDQSHGYPTEMAKYEYGPGDTPRSFYVPIPPGHTAWVGAHGDTASTGGLSCQPTVRGIAAGASTVAPVLGVNTPTRFSHSFPASGDQAGLELSLAPAEFTGRTVTLAGVMVQVLPTGQTPDNGPFISGQGASGLSFEGRVQPVPYSLAHDSFGLSVKLVETEDAR